MARAISQRCSEQPANASAFAKSSPGPIPRGLTERPSASFKQHCANGPTLAPTTTRISDRTSSCTGSIATLVERLVVFKQLPIADTPLANQQDEGVRLRDFLGERS